jgi:glycosyltransferase involved in cell wall biosynthesis
VHEAQDYIKDYEKVEEVREMKFHILVRAYNAEKYIGKCIRSILNQTIETWDALIVLDAPKDKTYSKVEPYVCDKIRCVVNKRRQGCSYNMYYGIGQLCPGFSHGVNYFSPDDAVAILDGDDWLPKHALRIVEKTYEAHPDALVTYGSYTRSSDGRKTKTSRPYPKGSNVRTAKWRASHLKTFRWSLVPMIKPNWFRDRHGNWLPAASDLALMIPLIRTVGLSKCIHIPKITYRYRNDAHERCDKKIQWRCEKIVRNMK